MITPPPIDTGDLWKSVDRLTRDRRERLVRAVGAGPGRASLTVVEHVPVPSLWSQLERAVGSTNSSDGGPSKSTGSRAPLDVGIAALMGDISSTLVRGLRNAKLTPRYLDQAVVLPVPTRATAAAVPARHGQAGPGGLGDPVHDPDQVGRLAERRARVLADARDRSDAARHRHDVPSDLQQLAAHIAAGAEGQRYVDDWVRLYARWVAQAETALALDTEDAINMRGIRGTPCPACWALSVVRYQDDGTYWDPALVVSLRDGQVLHATCRVCRTGWWRGDGLDELSAALAYPLTLAEERTA